MASNNEKLIFAFDAETGEPLPGLSPSWASLVNVADGAPVMPQPTIRALGAGVYAFTPTVPEGKHYAGVIDLGPDADPRFHTWDARPEDLLDVGSMVLRALGLLHENSFMDMVEFNVQSGKVSAGRLRIYDSKANTEAAKAASPSSYDTGKIAQYAIRAEYTGATLVNYMVTRE